MLSVECYRYIIIARLVISVTMSSALFYSYAYFSGDDVSKMCKSSSQRRRGV